MIKLKWRCGLCEARPASEYRLVASRLFSVASVFDVWRIAFLVYPTEEVGGLD